MRLSAEQRVTGRRLHSPWRGMSELDRRARRIGGTHEQAISGATLSMSAGRAIGIVTSSSLFRPQAVRFCDLPHISLRQRCQTTVAGENVTPQGG